MFSPQPNNIYLFGYAKEVFYITIGLGGVAQLVRAHGSYP